MNVLQNIKPLRCMVSMNCWKHSRAKRSTSSATNIRRLPKFLQNSFNNPEKTAIVDSNGEHSYSKLACLSMNLSRNLPSLHGERVAFLTDNDASYVACKWSTWMKGGTCVPLCKSHPISEIDYVLQDSEPKILIASSDHANGLEDLSKKHGTELLILPKDFIDQYSEAGILDDIDVQMSSHDNALIIYTSGTTGRPKGVVWTHDHLQKQIEMMLAVWEWEYNDRILHVLPLHHVHGIINAMMCPLSIGATVVMENKFQPHKVWDHFLGKFEDFPPISVFMAVPTIYIKLLQYYENNMKSKSDEIFEKCKKIRLMVSGSASLPATIFEKWKTLTSHELLERYGMTEVGMALTNSYRGQRIPGAVGRPFPGVEAMILAEDEENIVVEADCNGVLKYPGMKGHQGELLIRGPIFKEYWKRPDTTKEQFRKDGWFKTGDTAKFEDESFCIVGRTSVDIIKSGGFKIGALDIERHLLDHDNILEVAVLGVDDETWGQRVAAIIVLKDNNISFTVEDLKLWCSNRMPHYNTPTLMKLVLEIPKNAMGKVNKKSLLNLFDEEQV
uniref:malonate--CoA ligase ACSF3, mitochondrial-like n=1 Tax=Styela clava TaxID=7725 RepID=UPI0019396390|nr:malonate--CoA ligase ACSF3, mitochondrial-like [Styela clava]